VAPPDRHMLLEGEHLRLSAGPKENHARPAIDPLMRSAALSLGPRAIGVILTGQMDDGTAGLKDLKECGGIAIVQDPETAVEPEMPESALRNVDVDHCVALGGIAPLLVKLVGAPPDAARPPVPERIAREVSITQGANTMDNLAAIAHPSTLCCPDCGGSLWEVDGAKPLRYRCHIGHAYSVLSLESAQNEAAEQALWAGVRALRERELLMRRAAEIARSLGDETQARAGFEQADRVREQVRALMQFTEGAVAARESQDA
jgi:two-component system chemotaxis response regulator CheB